MGRTQRAISLVLLAVLAGLPVSGAVCGALCHPASRQDGTSAHSAADKSCHESSGPEHSETVAAVGHDCTSHEGGARRADSIKAGRSHVKPLSADDHLALVGRPLLSLTLRAGRWNDPQFSRTTFPTCNQLVLRI